MTVHPPRSLRPIGLALALFCATQAHADSLPEPRFQAVAAEPATVLAALRYAEFWNSGDEHYARQALADDFVDRTLPAGRAQGVSGPLQASKVFHAAVPDLRVEVMSLLAVGDRVNLQLHFRGHFTGRFGGRQGQGQPIDFQAFDLYRVENGRIAENWHLEDNLTLLRQLGEIRP